MSTPKIITLFLVLLATGCQKPNRGLFVHWADDDTNAQP